MEKRIPKIVVPPSLTEKEDVNKHFHEELDPCIKFIIECINDWECIKDGIVLDTDSSKEERENFLNLSLHIDELKILVAQLRELQKIHTSSFLYVLRCEEIIKILDPESRTEIKIPTPRAFLKNQKRCSSFTGGAINRLRQLQQIVKVPL